MLHFSEMGQSITAQGEMLQSTYCW